MPFTPSLAPNAGIGVRAMHFLPLPLMIKRIPLACNKRISFMSNVNRHKLNDAFNYNTWQCEPGFVLLRCLTLYPTGAINHPAPCSSGVAIPVLVWVRDPGFSLGSATPVLFWGWIPVLHGAVRHRFYSGFVIPVLV